MSIEDLNSVDLVATRPDSSIVRMIISDHLDWSDPHEHHLAIQNKINGYVAFIEAGQLQQLEGQSIPDDPDFRIELVMAHSPPPTTADFFEQVSQFLEEHDISFVAKDKSEARTW